LAYCSARKSIIGVCIRPGRIGVAADALVGVLRGDAMVSAFTAPLLAL
jgi:hypothetical protein